MPTLCILAGPNGTGKTTYYQTAIQKNFISPGLPFLNIDLENIFHRCAIRFFTQHIVKTRNILLNTLSKFTQSFE